MQCPKCKQGALRESDVMTSRFLFVCDDPHCFTFFFAKQYRDDGCVIREKPLITARKHVQYPTIEQRIAVVAAYPLW